MFTAPKVFTSRSGSSWTLPVKRVGEVRVVGPRSFVDVPFEYFLIITTALAGLGDFLVLLVLGEGQLWPNDQGRQVHARCLVVDDETAVAAGRLIPGGGDSKAVDAPGEAGRPASYRVQQNVDVPNSWQVGVPDLLNRDVAVFPQGGERPVKLQAHVHRR
jgi:hypothetical protein